MKIISLLIMLLSFDFPFNFPVYFSKNPSIESKKILTVLILLKLIMMKTYRK